MIEYECLEIGLCHCGSENWLWRIVGKNDSACGQCMQRRTLGSWRERPGTRRCAKGHRAWALMKSGVRFCRVCRRAQMERYRASRRQQGQCIQCAAPLDRKSKNWCTEHKERKTVAKRRSNAS